MSKTLAWANTDAANTMKSVLYQYLNSSRPRYRLEVENPGGELKVEVYDVRQEKDYYVGVYTIPAKATKHVDGADKDFQCHAIILDPVFVNTDTIKIVAYPTAVVAADTTVTFNIQGVTN
jgi:hypothetical protein